MPDTQEELQATEILMSILMASSRNPNGLKKEVILSILNTYGQVELYDLCAEVEHGEDEESEFSPEDIIGPPKVAEPNFDLANVEVPADVRFR